MPGLRATAHNLWLRGKKMAVNKIPESQLPVRSVSDTDYVRIVGADGKSYRVPKTDFNGGGGGGGTVDPSLSPTSTNAVQNKAIYSALSGLKDDLAQSASIDSSGLISFKNDSNVTVFTLQLPIYNGGVG